MKALYRRSTKSQLWLELLRDDCAIRDEAIAARHAEAGESIALSVTMVNRIERKKPENETGKLIWISASVFILLLLSDVSQPPLLLP
ncbi:MAG: hypothetical protein V9H26_20100 [Verrucomicrobiota bacterium]